MKLTSMALSKFYAHLKVSHHFSRRLAVVKVVVGNIIHHIAQQPTSNQSRCGRWSGKKLYQIPELASHARK